MTSPYFVEGRWEDIVAHNTAELAGLYVRVYVGNNLSDAEDPALGSELPTHDVGVSTRRSVGGAANGYLLVPIGDCAGCISADIRAWQAAAPQSGVKLVLLTSAGEDAIQKFRSGLGLHVPIVSDQKGSLIRSLNVLWPGRAYLYSPKWRLIWLQRDDRPRSDPFKDKGFLAALQEER